MLKLADPYESDPSLLRKHSYQETVHVPATDYTYPNIRLFHSPHPHEAKMPQLPLLVFIHGLGGSVAQFHPLLTSLVNIGPCLAIDLPGCGMSAFSPRYWNAYTTDSLVQLLAVLINKYREEDQEVVLICHSMGCSLGALLASKTSPYAQELSSHVRAIIPMCPPGKPMSAGQVSAARWLLSIPDPIFNLWRMWDRRGGTESHSVARFTGAGADEQLKKMQVRFNTQSRTPVFRRMAYGALPKFVGDKLVSTGGFVGKAIWEGVETPSLVIAGQDDPVTSPEDAIQVASYLGHTGTPNNPHEDACTSPPAKELIILPSPASHALLYSPTTVRLVSNFIQHFLSVHVSERLSLGWQLKYMCDEGKWDVKNLAKWKAVKPVSLPIAGTFRALKTLRERDDVHNPKAFVETWSAAFSQSGADGLGCVAAVVDISHDQPVYDPAGLKHGGIAYRKCPTVSKLPPTLDEVSAFIDVVDRLRATLLNNADPALTKVEIPDQNSHASGPDALSLPSPAAPPPLIAVHCHYGFNRTGFFIVAYLIERLGWPLNDAINEFQRARPPGIRHAHFVDELWGRYFDWADERAKS
jgi:pimeloyl-ACP methyl ester carboxylesterase